MFSKMKPARKWSMLSAIWRRWILESEWPTNAVTLFHLLKSMTDFIYRAKAEILQNKFSTHI